MTERAKCDSCGWEGPLGKVLPDIPGLEERVDPNGPMPVGECPKCRFLAYLVEKAVIKVHGINGVDVLTLGVQTQMANVYQEVHWKACTWAPKQAKSYDILDLRHTDYHGKRVEGVSGYANFQVRYYRRVEDGCYPVVPAEHLRNTLCKDSDPRSVARDDAMTPSGTNSSTTSKKRKRAVKKS